MSAQPITTHTNLTFLCALSFSVSPAIHLLCPSPPEVKVLCTQTSLLQSWGQKTKCGAQLSTLGRFIGLNFLDRHWAAGGPHVKMLVLCIARHMKRPEVGVNSVKVYGQREKNVRKTMVGYDHPVRVFVLCWGLDSPYLSQYACWAITQPGVYVRG